MERELNEYICMKCGKSFFTYGKTKRRLCDDCVKENRRMANLKYYQETCIGVETAPKKKEHSKSLMEIMRELNAYNEEHGTFLTYGKYIALTSSKRKSIIK